MPFTVRSDDDMHEHDDENDDDAADDEWPPDFTQEARTTASSTPALTTTTTTTRQGRTVPVATTGMIYSVPTTDTWGEDESLWRSIRPYHHHHHHQDTNNNNNNHQHNNRTAVNNVFRTHFTAATDPLQTTHDDNNNNDNDTTMTTHGGGSGVPPPGQAVRLPLPRIHSRQRSRRRRRQRRHDDDDDNNHNGVTTREFTGVADAPTVTVRFVPTWQRRAFDGLSPPSWERYTRVRGRVARLSFPSSSQQREREQQHSSVSHHRRLSPSPQHLRLLHTLQAQNWCRQVEYGPSIGRDAGTTTQPNNNNNKPNNNDEDDDDPLTPLNVVRAYANSFPSHTGDDDDEKNDIPAPQLSHRRRRLPTRADVGFAGATTAQIQRKQDELRWETAWEEASPRIIVLCTADDLGVAVQQHHEHDDDEEPQRRRYTSRSRRTPDGTGLPGMPFAGRPLRRAARYNARAWGRRRHHDDDHDDDERSAESVDNDDDDDDVLHHPTSLLAPPRQATPSRRWHWRPRLFHDRAPDRRYVVACPTDLMIINTTTTTADQRDDSPACSVSLALYQVPHPHHNRHHDNHTTTLRGKVSEDVYFHIDHHSTPSSAQQTRPQRYNKVKAVVSVEPNTASQCVWVVRVFKPTNTAGTNNHRHASLLVPWAWGVLPWRDTTVEPRQASPPTWPEGRSSHVPLYPWTTGESSPEDLMDRIAQIVYDTDAHNDNNNIHSNNNPGGGGGASSSHHSLAYSNSVAPSSAASVDSDVVVKDTPITSSTSSVTATPSKRGISRLFRSPRLTRTTSKSSSHATTPAANTVSTQLFPSSLNPMSSKPIVPNKVTVVDAVPMAPPQPLEGWNLKLFVSFLGTDFLNALLSTPKMLLSSHHLPEVPRLLVDPMGDAAVSLPPQPQRAVDLPVEEPKRSDLVRLPPLADKLAGYAEAAEFREVLPLQPRLEKHYPLDAPFGTRALVNLLYVYPRVVRLSSSAAASSWSSTTALENVTVRVRLLQTEIVVDDDTGKILSRNVALAHLYSPVPGDCLVDKVYTKVQGSMTGHAALDFNMGVPLGDEIKVRLPDILDGSYTLEFSLMQVQQQQQQDQQLDDVSVTSLGGTSVPLSSSSRESSTGNKVTTVIPNGIHRVKIGDFQLQVETRLVSSIHVSDPAVALALRDFPFTEFQGDSAHGEPGRLRSTASADSAVDFHDSFPSLLATANPSAVVAHVRPLLHMHLGNFVNLNERGRNDVSAAVQFISGNTMSLFEVLRCVKAFFRFGPTREVDDNTVRLLLKEVVDGFDEGYLSPASSPDGETAEAVVESPSKEDRPVIERSASADSAVSVASVGEGSVRMQARRKLYKKYEQRVNKIVAALGNPGTPFARAAYGATKADRMRVEAEIVTDDAHFNVFDDDETIMTELTSPRGAHVEGNPDLVKRKSRSGLSEAMKKDLSANSILHSASSGLKEQTKEKRPSTGSGGGGGNEFARRMRDAAQTMLAPCVGPSLSNILASARGTSLPTQTMSDNGQPDEEAVFSKANEGKTGVVFLPGSDDEDDAVEQNRRPHIRHGNGNRVFRGVPDGPMFILSSKPLDENEDVFAGGHFLYESIIVLWLRNWTEHFLSTVSPKHHRQSPQFYITTVPIPPLNPLRPVENSIVSFFHHMDLLLPVCLKSIVLRYTAEVLPIYPITTRVQLDARHRKIFEDLTEMLARGLVGMAVAGLGSSEETETALGRAVSAADAVVEFLLGLIPIFHAEHMRVLLSRYLKVLRDAETEHLGHTPETEFEWNKENLLRVRSSRQLRLHAVELLASLPSFCYLNYPCKVEETSQQSKPAGSSWLNQHPSNERHAFDEEIRTIPEYPDGLQRAPTPGWLASLVIDEALSVCSLSSEAVIAEALAHAEVSRQHSANVAGGAASSLKRRPGAALHRNDLLMFQSLSIQAIHIVYELVLRRNAVDRRFQSDSTRRRIAAMFALPILEKSVTSVRWLARMESTHKVRSLWLLCFVYVLQEAPDSLVQEFIRSCCDPKNIRVHRFIRLLRICSSSFQGFVDRPRKSSLPSRTVTDLSAWLLQESFNTICATTNTVVEACVDFTSKYPQEKRKVMQGLIDLLLHILTTPQSSVTHLRALGGALQTMEQFGIDLFLEVTGDNFQHWVRILLSLMNSPSLSVRSMSVDFAVSLLGGAFDCSGTIDDVALVITTVLPEVVAREIALYNVSGQLGSFQDIPRCVWPLRRALTDIQDANPLDDDRVDPQLPPRLRAFGRACQAVIDGVLVEMRLKDNRFLKVDSEGTAIDVFDADEESLFEAAGSFCPETSPLQRIRWLNSLRALHERNERWIEAAETGMLCAETIVHSLLYLKSIWRPTNFALWTDSTRSHWLENVGEDIGQPDFGNREVMDFANAFLEPEDFFASVSKKSSASGRLQQPTIGIMSDMLNDMAKDATDLYLKETGCEELAMKRLETLLQALSSSFEEVTKTISGRALRGRRRQVEDEAVLRRIMSNISVARAKLSERVLDRTVKPQTKNLLAEPSRVYVCIRITGKKLKRFVETVALPPFLEWNEYCVCAVPTSEDQGIPANRRLSIAKQFAKPLVEALNRQASEGKVRHVNVPHRAAGPEDDVVLEAFPVDPSTSLTALKGLTLTTRRFGYRKADLDSPAAIDLTVSLEFPCALSRQRSLVTSDFSFYTT